MNTAPTINTPLQRGDSTPERGETRFNGFRLAGKTVETVPAGPLMPHTLLKQGANERLRCNASAL